MDEELLDNLHAQVSVLEKEIKYIQSESIQLELILRQKDEEILQERANHSKLLQEKDRYMGAIRDEKKEIAEVRVATELEQHNSNELLLTRQKLLEEKSAKEFDYRESIEVCDNELRRLETEKAQKDVGREEFYSDSKALGALASVYRQKRGAEALREEMKEEEEEK